MTSIVRIVGMTVLWMVLWALGMDLQHLLNEGSTWSTLPIASAVRAFAVWLGTWGIALALQPRPRRLAIGRSGAESLAGMGLVMVGAMALGLAGTADLVTWMAAAIVTAQISVVLEAGVLGPLGVLRRVGVLRSPTELEAGRGLAYDRGRVLLLLQGGWGAIVAALVTSVGVGAVAGVAVWGRGKGEFTGPLMVLTAWTVALPLLATVSYPATLYAVGVRIPEDEAPLRSGSFGPFHWFEFPSSPGRRAWTFRRATAEALRDRPPPPPASDGHGLRITASAPGDPQGGWALLANLQAISAVLGFGPACLAGLMLLGALATTGDAGGALYAFFAPVALFVYPSLFALGLLLGPMWLLPRLLGRLFRPAGQLALTGDMLTADGRRYYLAGAVASLSHGPFGAVLTLEGPDGRLRIRGDHATLSWLQAYVSDRVDRSSDGGEDQRRLQAIAAARSREQA